ncbi:MAG: hypothetical protein ACK53F_10870 [Betaproteobacteria bacterium]
MSNLKSDKNQMELDLKFDSEPPTTNLQQPAEAKILSLAKRLELKSHDRLAEDDENLRKLYSGILKSVEHIK